MNMKKILLFITFSAIYLISLCCVSCAEYQKQESAVVANSYVFPYFTKIVVSGNARVELIDKGGKPYLYCNGAKQDIDHISAQVKEDTLYLSSSSTAPYIKLNISNPRLIMVTDHAYVKADNLTAKRLAIVTSGAGSITLQGKIGLEAVAQRSKGKIDVKWVDSAQLKVISDSSGPIYLAGVVKTLEAKLQKNSYFDARYLRAETATIMATDKVQAHVLAKMVLNAYADKNSNIYYHKRPQQLNKVSQDSGNVFLMELIQ